MGVWKIGDRFSLRPPLSQALASGPRSIAKFTKSRVEIRNEEMLSLRYDLVSLAFEVRTAAPSDFITSAGRQGRYILPSRDLLVNDIEVQVEGALLDGMVCLASCDKTAPGQLMAAARLDILSLVVACGYQPHGYLDGRAVDIEEVYESVGKVGAGHITLEQLGAMCDVAIQGPGVCAGVPSAPPERRRTRGRG